MFKVLINVSNKKVHTNKTNILCPLSLQTTICSRYCILWTVCPDTVTEHQNQKCACLWIHVFCSFSPAVSTGIHSRAFIARTLFYLMGANLHEVLLHIIVSCSFLPVLAT
jgi:hypothetical protein